MSSALNADLDDQNLVLLDQSADVDKTNATFYAKYPFPCRAQRLERPMDPDLERLMVCQDLGDWSHKRLPNKPAIWVAGCGTNQAVMTALSFPKGQIIGSDVSPRSVEIASLSAADLGLSNLTLRVESLNDASYREQFDYIICTGVIHHNANPAESLKALARALKPNGVLQLMVYNRYHRITSSCMQKALRVLSGDTVPGSERQQGLASILVKTAQGPGLIGDFLRAMRDARPEELADGLMQPIEHSYTIASLAQLAQSAGLELELPCLNQFDQMRGRFDWNLQVTDPEVKRYYTALPDLDRWYVTNLLLCERSPLLWFYLRPQNVATRSTEAQICESFLESRFTRVISRRSSYTLRADDKYHADRGSVEFPPPAERPFSAVVADADGQTTMRALLHRHGLPTSFPEVNISRLRLSSTAFPYLRAVAQSPSIASVSH
ncbi:MAG TPA: class I SAM-dependent methyltransferase [Steroidobacteraceae bacterium]|nr:class I SAM-dependent methyltransferase [Steroidobacteraceae bacterium]